MIDVFINPSATIIQTLKKLDQSAQKVLLVVDKKKKLLGAITDGDIRRHILKAGNFDDVITEIYNKNPIFCFKRNFSPSVVKKILLSEKINLVPLLNNSHCVVDVIAWDQIFGGETGHPHRKKINIPAVIMAGGEGVRLRPFTKVLPKPLIPVGEMTIIERIIGNFRQSGVKKFFVILNYQGALIETFLNNLPDPPDITYIREKDFLGTAGGLKMLEKRIQGNFIVSNCDVLVKADYGNLLKAHTQNEVNLTILSAIQHHRIPYGVIKFEKGGEVTQIEEKPEQTITINTGIYLLNEKALKFIPRNTSFHMTDLIKVLLKNKQKVFTYPVNENDYIDIGQWDVYKDAVEKLTVLTKSHVPKS